MERESLLIAGCCLVLFAFFLLLYWLNARFKKFINEEYLTAVREIELHRAESIGHRDNSARLRVEKDKLKASLSALRMEETSLLSENGNLKAELGQLKVEYMNLDEKANRLQRTAASLEDALNESNLKIVQIDNTCDALREIADEKMHEVIQLRKQLAIAKGLATRYKNELKKYKPF